MSTKHTTNGNITLTSFAELGTYFDVPELPEAPTLSAECEHAPESEPTAERGAELSQVVAQLASMSGGLKSMAREDARAREQATIELARYEALVGERQDAERGLAEARRVRAVAEQLAAQAFSEEARARAAQHVSGCRALELRCIELLAERTRAAEELVTRPELARALAERQRLVDEQRTAAQILEAERATRLSAGLVAVDRALGRDELDEAEQVVEHLAGEFGDHVDVRRKRDVVRWRLRNRLLAPAEEALRDVARRTYRDDPQATVKRLAEVHTEGLPEDLARRVFGVWSNACWQLVEARGWLDARREAPAISRGAVWARTPGGPYEVVSSLNDPRWQTGQIVPDRIAQAAPALRPATTRGQGSSR